MKKFVIALFLVLPFMVQAQSVLTPEQQLEKAKQEARAAKEAVKEARKAAKRAAKEAKKAEKNEQKKADNARIQAEIERANQEAAHYKAEAERIKNRAKQAEEEHQKTDTNVQQGWSIPDANATDTNGKSATQQKGSTANASSMDLESSDAKYLEGSVTVDADHKVVFTLDLNVSGKTAKQIYDLTYQYLDNLTKAENQIQSRIALVNQGEHIIAARYTEWLEFNQSFLSLDRTEFDYTLIAKCKDNHLELTMSRLHYDYEKNRPTHLSVSAEEWITDEKALNKKKNKLRPLAAKFRRKTIDRKDEIFSQITDLLQR